MQLQLKDFLDMIHDDKHKEESFFYDLDEINLYVGIEVKVDNQVMLELSGLLGKCINLQSFVLPYGFIGINFDNGIINYSKLFDALKTCKKLKKLDISFNQFGRLNNEEIKSFCELVECSELECINLKDNDLNELSYENLSMLFTSIKKCKTLNNLDISYNDFHIIEEDKFNIICDSLMACENLLYFDMRCPYIAQNRQYRLLEIKSLVLSRLNHTNNNIISVQDQYNYLSIFDKFTNNTLKKDDNGNGSTVNKEEPSFSLPKCTIV